MACSRLCIATQHVADLKTVLVTVHAILYTLDFQTYRCHHIQQNKYMFPLITNVVERATCG